MNEAPSSKPPMGPPPQRRRERPHAMSPEITTVVKALYKRADQLQDEALHFEEHSMARLLSNRVSSEFRKLAKELSHGG